MICGSIYTWDLSQYIYGELSGNIVSMLIISVIIFLLLTAIILKIFKEKDIVNES